MIMDNQSSFKNITNLSEILLQMVRLYAKYKEEPKQIPSKTDEILTSESVEKDPKSNFIKDLRLNEEENPSLLKLQNQFEKNEIDLSVLSDDERNDLDSLYIRQIAKLNKELNDKKTELNIIQHKINSYSTNM